MTDHVLSVADLEVLVAVAARTTRALAQDLATIIVVLNAAHVHPQTVLPRAEVDTLTITRQDVADPVHLHQEISKTVRSPRKT